MKLQETVYDALGKAWPSLIEHKLTQGKSDIYSLHTM